EALAAEIARAGGKAVPLAADLADEADVAELLPRAMAALGPIGCLVNNASIFENETALAVTRDSWDRHLAINLRAPFVLTQSFARHLAEEAGGGLIHPLHEGGWDPTPHFVSLTLRKTGLWAVYPTHPPALA